MKQPVPSRGLTAKKFLDFQPCPQTRLFPSPHVVVLTGLKSLSFSAHKQVFPGNAKRAMLRSAAGGFRAVLGAAEQNSGGTQVSKFYECPEALISKTVDPHFWAKGAYLYLAVDSIRERFAGIGARPLQ